MSAEDGDTLPEPVEGQARVMGESSSATDDAVRSGLPFDKLRERQRRHVLNERDVAILKAGGPDDELSGLGEYAARLDDLD